MMTYPYQQEFIMIILQSLKVVSAKRPNQASPITQRRTLLLKKIHEQIATATARSIRSRNCDAFPASTYLRPPLRFYFS
jgi:hypothetical protein